MSKKTLTGEVVSNKMQNTVVVSVEKIKEHNLYHKKIKRNTKYKAHDTLKAQIGDKVVIEEHSPISKDKKWIVKEIIKETKGVTK